MTVLDPGHLYRLAFLDEPDTFQHLRFVKRDSVSHPGGFYPGNVGSYPGTNLQEVLRALIDRVKYLDNQVPCAENQLILMHLRESLYLLEQRAAERHGRVFLRKTLDGIENEVPCKRCGHLECGHDQHVTSLTT